jgi:hypothetical protein
MPAALLGDGGRLFATIAWASDGSAPADHALESVVRLAAGHQAMVWVIHVAPGAAPPNTRGEAEEAIIAKLKGQVRELRDHGFAASLYVVRATSVPIGMAIAVTAQAVDADLLIVDRRRQPPAQAPSHGVLSPGLLAAVSCPVLVLPPKG